MACRRIYRIKHAQYHIHPESPKLVLHWRPCCWRSSTHRHKRTACGRCCIAATQIGELGSDGSWPKDDGMKEDPNFFIFFSDGNWIQGMFSLFFFSSDPISIHKILLFARIVGNQREFDCFLRVVGWYSHRCWVCDSHHLIIFASFRMIPSFFSTGIACIAIPSSL